MPLHAAGSTGNADFAIAVLPGDGIGPEVMAPCLELLDGLGTKYGYTLSFNTMDAGADLYSRTGNALPQKSSRRRTRPMPFCWAPWGIQTFVIPMAGRSRRRSIYASISVYSPGFAPFAPIRG